MQRSITYNLPSHLHQFQVLPISTQKYSTFQLHSTGMWFPTLQVWFAKGWLLNICKRQEVAWFQVLQVRFQRCSINFFLPLYLKTKMDFWLTKKQIITGKSLPASPLLSRASMDQTLLWKKSLEQVLWLMLHHLLSLKLCIRVGAECCTSKLSSLKLKGILRKLWKAADATQFNSQACLHSLNLLHHLLLH